MERAGAVVLQAVRVVTQEILSKEPRAVVAALQSLARAIGSMVVHLDMLLQSKTTRGMKVIAQRLKPYVLAHSAWKEGTDMHMAVFLYGGESPLLPMLLAVLGVQHGTHQLQRHRAAFMRSGVLPSTHLVFLRKLSRGQSARDFLYDLAQTRVDVHVLAIIEAEYNECLEQLHRLCSRRSNIACRYLPGVSRKIREELYGKDIEMIRAAHSSLLMDRRKEVKLKMKRKTKSQLCTNTSTSDCQMHARRTARLRRLGMFVFTVIGVTYMKTF